MPQPGRSDRRSARRGPPRRSSLEILYEDDQLIAVNKPAGLSSTASRSDSRRTLHDMVLDHVRSNAETSQRVRPVNQLDREVSGIMIFAKSQRMENALETLFRTNRARRTYKALVCGTLDDGATGTIQAEIGPKQRRRTKQPQDTRRPAITHYRLVRQSASHALVQLRPETHRRDQLLWHMQHIEHPIVGAPDSPASRTLVTRLMLHLEQIAFEHPKTRKDLRLIAPCPDDFARFLDGEPTSSQHDSSEAAPTSWQPVAEWYGDYQTSQRSDHFSEVIHPGVHTLLGEVRGSEILDLACGEGRFATELAERGASVLGIDAAHALIVQAEGRAMPRTRFLTGDVSRLDDLGESAKGPFGAAVCIMALMNIADLDSTLHGLRQRLKPGAPFVAAILHPAFRSPRQTSWSWDDDQHGKPTQYRRVDAYMSERATPITMNPGSVASGGRAIETMTFHRPISRYMSALREAGFVIDAIEEWTSTRRSQPGPRADAENTARREIPLFLGIRAIPDARTEMHDHPTAESLRRVRA